VPVPVPVPEAEPVAPETVRAVAPLPLAEKPAAKPFGGHPRTKPPADEVLGDKLQLDLPPVPAEAPTVSTPSNPY